MQHTACAIFFYSVVHESNVSAATPTEEISVSKHEYTGPQKHKSSHTCPILHIIKQQLSLHLIK